MGWDGMGWGVQVPVCVLFVVRECMYEDGAKGALERRRLNFKLSQRSNTYVLLTCLNRMTKLDS